jgi:hypothetical protein
MEETQEYLCFIKFIGTDVDGLNIYEFLFTNTIDSFWGENFEVFPSCLCNELIPNESEYNLVKQIKTELKFNLAQESCCTSYQDAIDGIIAICWEDISEYEYYPDNGRLVLHFGITYGDCEEKLNAKEIHFEE